MAHAVVLLTALALVDPASQTVPTMPASPRPVASVVDTADAGYVPERVYDSDRKRFSDFEAMLADLTHADVVFVGEQHDDPNTHRLEHAMLEGLARRRGAIILSLEMFERDVQPLLDQYLAGQISEEDFVRQSRPWPRYKTDYRPLVEFAKAHGWPVVAANVPRKYASEVSKAGMAYLTTVSDGERGFAAKEFQCPFDRYFDRFAETMRAHPMPGDEKKSVAERRQTTERFYFAQCVKDETMAESIVDAYRRAASSRPIVVHFNGSFHSDYAQGTAGRVDRRLRGVNVKIVTMLPIESLDPVRPSKNERKMADYLVYTVKPPVAPPAK
jgi:uncharacterized iron-regulated protein